MSIVICSQDLIDRYLGHREKKKLGLAGLSRLH